jgi:hypothetical protein
LSGLHDLSTHLSPAPESSPLVPFVRSRRQRRDSLNLANFQDPLWRQAGQDLHALAETFSRSHERHLVRLKAEQVDIEGLDSAKFMEMLRELFLVSENAPNP